jgi:glycosyltransferase involved in cell wall biosynthesis
VEHGVTGVLVARGDVADLARAMLELVHDPTRADAMGHAARDRAERLFDARTVARETLAAMGLG